MLNIKRFHNRHIKIATKEMSSESSQILIEIDDFIYQLFSRKSEQVDEVAEEQTKVHNFRILLKQLNRVPFNERSIKWSERYVQIYTYGQIKKARCKALYYKIIDRYLLNGDSEKLNSFKKRVKIASFGRIYTNHGLSFELKNFSADDLSNELGKLFSLLKSIGYKPFINSGTLLGAERDGRFIKHDDDIDLGVYLGESNAGNVVLDLLKLKNSLSEVLGDEFRCRLSPKSPLVKLNLKGCILVDIFPAWSEGDKFFIWPYCFGELQLSSLIPFEKRMLGSMEFDCPKDVYSVLNQNYGPNWRVPDPHFKFDWSLASQKFSELKTIYRNVYKIHGEKAGLKKRFRKIRRKYKKVRRALINFIFFRKRKVLKYSDD